MARHDYWRGVDIVADMDLGLLERIEHVLHQARRDAEHTLEEIHGWHAGVYPRGISAMDGPELRKLYMRMFFNHLLRRFKFLYEQAQRNWWDHQRATQKILKGMVDNADRWKDDWPEVYGTTPEEIKANALRLLGLKEDNGSD